VKDYTDMPQGELYVTSFYFTVTTIVTVGYGDITPVSIGFSFVTGSLASLIQNEDSNQAKLKESLHILQEIREEYNIGNKLYSHLVQAI
jgi:Ion channel